MQRRRVFLAAAVCVVFLACGDEQSDRSAYRGSIDYEGSGLEVVPSGMSADVPSYAWRMPTAPFKRAFAVHALDNDLAVVLDYAHPFMHLIDIRAGKYLRPLQPEGDDGSAVSVFRLAVSPNDRREFAGYDLGAGTITRFRLTDANGPLQVLGVVQMRATETVDGIVWNRDGSIGVEPMRDSVLRAIVSENGELDRFSGMSMAALAPAWVPPRVWREGMEGFTCANPERTKLARAWSYAGRFAILGADGSVIPGRTREQLFGAHFEMRPTGEVVFMSQGPDSRAAYRGCAATDDFAFGLFSGRYTAGARGRNFRSFPALMASQIHVFDWQGKPLGGFRLQLDASAMDVTPDGTRLLALVSGVESGLTAYKMPRKFGGRR